jgi:hypothetical protein
MNYSDIIYLNGLEASFKKWRKEFELNRIALAKAKGKANEKTKQLIERQLILLSHIIHTKKRLGSIYRRINSFPAKYSFLQNSNI